MVVIVLKAALIEILQVYHNLVFTKNLVLLSSIHKLLVPLIDTFSMVGIDI